MNPLLIGTNGSIAALDPSTGEILWATELKTRGLISSTRGEDVSVILRDGQVFAGCSGHLFCLSVETGEMLWHNDLKGFGHNDVSLALEGVSVQYLEKVVRRSS
ncbi:PQQ-binding-like beta-propeller repeat protein [Luteolibacter arcticus]|uniref:PQQ-binding-like beta-propeller repeat protein n=1 Tax=Luteolibacter arcticus TaxID=1581411 RepID=A0ABT3GMC5_9BACT|nr:PQQ-binding-like beta-propeller repeat protein [Luteolibacter arcticus]MCW1924647.1 PQQ-binding-like beta-propeller repeat protein [Luteolibacter arcticus]